MLKCFSQYDIEAFSLQLSIAEDDGLYAQSFVRIMLGNCAVSGQLPANEPLHYQLYINGQKYLDFTDSNHSGIQLPFCQLFNNYHVMPDTLLDDLVGQIIPFCMIVKAPGDTNPTNDTACYNVEVLPPAVMDLEVSNQKLYIGNEAIEDGVLQFWQEIDSLNFTLKNLGPDSWPTLGVVLVDVLIDGIVVAHHDRPFFMNRGSNEYRVQLTSQTSETPFGQILPLSNGPFELCIKANYFRNDSNLENNTTCGSESAQFHMGPASISKETSNPSTINVFPNPGVSGFQLSSMDSNPMRLNVYNYLGKLQFSTHINNSETWVDMNHLASGIYQISIVGTDNLCNQSTLKWIKL